MQPSTAQEFDMLHKFKLVRSVGVVLFFTISSAPARAQETVANVRFGLNRKTTSHRVAEIFSKRGRFTVPHVGYTDFGQQSDYRAFMAGLGYDAFSSEELIVTTGFNLVQSAGKSSHNTLYIQPWVEGVYEGHEGFEAEVSVSPHIPINSSGLIQLMVEEAKVERRLTSFLKFGVGYGADKFRGERLEHKPFLTTTVRPWRENLGSLEFWWQRAPHGGSQVQLHWELTRSKEH